jgi:hypothetical protein
MTKLAATTLAVPLLFVSLACPTRPGPEANKPEGGAPDGAAGKAAMSGGSGGTGGASGGGTAGSAVSGAAGQGGRAAPSGGGGAAGASGTIQSPRQIAPLSTATATSRRPAFHWILAPNTDGARIQICRERTCSSVVMTIDATGTSGAPTGDLPTGVSFWRLFGRAGTAVGTSPSATWEVRVGVRSAPLDTSWGTMVDVNGDGYADVIVASQILTDNGPPPSPPPTIAGYVRVYTGGPTGLATVPATTLTDPDGAGSNFGNSVASAGDINGDGYPDVVVGANAVSGNAGRAYIFLGGPNGLATTPASTIVGPDGQGALFGASVSSAGDVNGDGYSDVIVGAQFGNLGAGSAYVFLGSGDGISLSPATSLTTSLDSTDTYGYFGHSVASAGDVNGDGFSDVVVGAYALDGNSGRSYVYLGSSSGLARTASTTLSPPSGAIGFGFSVASAGDVNGDGYADVVVGGGGSTFVYSGGASGTRDSPQTSLIGYGSVLSIGGDVNGDGFADVVVCDPSANNSAGMAWIFGGRSLGVGVAPLTTLMGPSGPGGNFGASVAGGADINGDGIGDVIVGAPGLGAGSLYVYLGSVNSFPTTPSTTVAGPSTDSSFGLRLD